MGDAPSAGNWVLSTSYPSVNVPDASMDHDGHLLDGVPWVACRDRLRVARIGDLVRPLARTLRQRRDTLADDDDMLRDLTDLILLPDKGFAAGPEGRGLLPEHLGHLLDRDILKGDHGQSCLVYRLPTVLAGGRNGRMGQRPAGASWVRLVTHNMDLSNLARIRSRRLASTSCLTSKLGGRLRHLDANLSSPDSA